jgi:hypothetical protein
VKSCAEETIVEESTGLAFRRAILNEGIAGKTLPGEKMRRDFMCAHVFHNNALALEKSYRQPDLQPGEALIKVLQAGQTVEKGKKNSSNSSYPRKSERKKRVHSWLSSSAQEFFNSLWTLWESERCAIHLRISVLEIWFAVFLRVLVLCLLAHRIHPRIFLLFA